MTLQRRVRSMVQRTLPAVLLTLLAAVWVESLPAAQETVLGGQSMRPFRFVFIAYAIAWALVFGWVFSVGRRLARLEERLRS